MSQGQGGQSQSWKQTAGGLMSISARYGSGEQLKLQAEQSLQQYRDSEGYLRLPLSHKPNDSLGDDEVERSNVDISISDGNKGFRLLAKMGWKEGDGLGKKGQGRIDPLPFDLKMDKLGLGKALEYELKAIAATESRKEMESERQAKESEEDAKRRLEAVAVKEKIAQDVKEIRSVFFCDICNKGYKTVPEWDNHLSSYDHHHAKRMMEFKEQQKLTGEDLEKEMQERAKREAKRQAKDLEKLRAASGNSETKQSVQATDIDKSAKPIKFGFGMMGKAKSKLQPPPKKKPPAPSAEALDFD